MKTIKQIAMAIVLLLAAQVGAQNIGDQAPNFTLDKLNGGTFSLADQMGKVVFVFTFGNSCPHCLANAPGTESGVYSSYKSDPNFVAVGVDAWDGSTGQVQSFQVTTGVSYPLLLKGSSMVSSYGTTYDRIIVVDQNGVIRYKGTSNASANVVADASGIISDLLQTAGVDDHIATEVKLEAVFLNAQNVLEVNNPFNAEKKVAYCVMDLSGRVLEQNYFQMTDFNLIQLDKSVNGLNFISLSDGESTYTAKFVRK